MPSMRSRLSLIHPSAWKVNAPKSICRIVHKPFPLADESPPEAGPRRSSKPQRLVVVDKNTEKRMPAYSS